MELIKINQEREPLIDDMFAGFKGHLRILHDVEDDEIKDYLGAAIEAIGIFAGNEIFPTTFKVFYPMDSPDYRLPSSLFGWYCGRWNVSSMVIQDAKDRDVTGDYTIDYEKGMVYPHPHNMKIELSTGYSTAVDVPHNLRIIIYRLGADFYENREANRVGEPKMLPGWLTHSLASIWQPRV